MTDRQNQDERIEDLDVAEHEAEDVRGGSLNFTRTGGQGSLKITDAPVALESFSRGA
jgi:hypothetical protein